MSISSEKFSALTTEFPNERKAIEGLKALVGTGKRLEMSLNHLVLNLQPADDLALTRILERLVVDGTISRVYRVESPQNHGKIEDFGSFEDIPGQIADFHTGTTVAVTPRNMHVVYELV
jgi:hypothetical protein